MGGLQVLTDPQQSCRVGLEPQNGSAAEWRAAGAAQQGRSHLETSTPCQDHVATRTFPDGTVTGALSDGAGSSRFSHYGAQLLVARAQALLQAQFEPLFRATNNLGSLRTRLVEDLRGELRELASAGINFSEEERKKFGLPPRTEQAQVQCDLQDLAATLLVVAINGGRFVALHIGDGVIGIEHLLKSGPRTKPLSVPDNGEFINETRFITSQDAEEYIRVFRGHLDTRTRNIIGFVLMSDGPEVSLYKRTTNEMAQACSKLLNAGRELPEEVMNEQLAVTLKEVIAPRTHDDCSIVLIARSAAPTPVGSGMTC